MEKHRKNSAQRVRRKHGGYMLKIIFVVFVLLAVCVTAPFAQPIEKELSKPITAAEETSYEKQLRPNAHFGPFELYGQRFVAADRYIPENGNYVFEIRDSKKNVLYVDKHDGDYLVENVYKIVGNSGEGLLIIRDLEPNAPPCGPEFQVLGLKNGKIKELSKSIIMCGYMVDKPINTETKTIILSKNNILTAAFSDSNYFVKVPFKVDFKNLTLLPEKNTGEFSVDYNRKYEMDMEGFDDLTLNLFSSRDLLSKKSSIFLREVKTFEVLGVYASVKIQDAGRHQSELVISDKAIKVRVNGIIYWLNGEDKGALDHLGVPPFD